MALSNRDKTKTNTCHKEDVVKDDRIVGWTWPRVHILIGRVKHLSNIVERRQTEAIWYSLDYFALLSIIVTCYSKPPQTLHQTPPIYSSAWSDAQIHEETSFILLNCIPLFINCARSNLCWYITEILCIILYIDIWQFWHSRNIAQWELTTALIVMFMICWLLMKSNF